MYINRKIRIVGRGRMVSLGKPERMRLLGRPGVGGWITLRGKKGKARIR
jgi:hypothetical protein